MTTGICHLSAAADSIFHLSAVALIQAISLSAAAYNTFSAVG